MGDVPQEYDNGDNNDEYIQQDTNYIPAEGDQPVTEEYTFAPFEYHELDPQYQGDQEFVNEIDQKPTTEFEVNQEFDSAIAEDTRDVYYPEPEDFVEVYENDVNNSNTQVYHHKKDSRESSTGSAEQQSGSGSEHEAGNGPSKSAFDHDNDDGNWDKLRDDDKPSSPTIHISKLIIKNRAEAVKIANIIIEVVEEDVANYLQQKGIVPNSEHYDEYGRQKPIRREISKSSLSDNSTESIPEPGEPSTMRLFYTREDNDLRDISIPNLQAKLAVDEYVEVNLHGSKKLGKGAKTSDAETQTKNMALITNEKAEMIYWSMYPKPDDWKPPLVPSRQPSMQWAVDKAAESDKNVDKATIKPQIKRSIKKRILKPLPEDYYKDETFWTGSRFRGEYKNRQLHLGYFDFATGTTYESEFKNGHAHSRNHTGLLVYPRGDTYEGQWRKGRYQAGEIVFADGLKYEPRDWNYCIPPDRRFKSEKILGIHAAGNTIYNDRFPPTEQQKLPPGCFDVGEGIYDPKTSTVTGYDGAYLRDITSYEHRWIVTNCRKAKYPREVYIPKFSDERLPGSSCEKRPCNK